MDFTKVAARQHGVVTRAQLVASGLGENAIDRRIESGALLRLYPGVYAVAGAPETFQRQLVAAALAAGGIAAASHRAAAFLLGLGEVRPVVEISVPRSQRPRLGGRVVLHRVARLSARDTFELNGVTLTNRPRTIRDLASVLTPRELALVLDHALKHRIVTRAAIVHVMGTYPRNAKGLGTLRALLAERPSGRARVDSPLELDLQETLRRAELDGEPQYLVAGHPVDVAFPEAKLAVQANSFLHHSTRTDWARDQRRNAAIAAEGWRVLPVTKEDLEDPKALVAKIRSALASVTFTPTGRG